MTSSATKQPETAEVRKARPSAVLSFAAPLEGGKTTISTNVATRFVSPHVGFGGYLPRPAQEMGLEVTRENLQDLGDQLVRCDVRAFCEEVLKQQPWQPGRPLVIDGVRHVEVLDVLSEILAPVEGYLIYINVDRTTQSKRFEHDELRHEKSLEEFERHPTEIQVRCMLPDRAALGSSQAPPPGLDTIRDKEVGYSSKSTSISNS
jgi:hypothetical protein